MRNVFAAAVLMGTMMAAGTALAVPHDKVDDVGSFGRKKVPELNAETAGAALALVIGGAAVVLGRRRRQQQPKA